MKAMVFEAPGTPLRLKEVPVPKPEAGQILVRVRACGVCRTDLHVYEGDLSAPKRPLIPGHEIVGSIAGIGRGVEGLSIGERVGIPWLGKSCRRCDYCRSDRENLCDHARFTGYQLDGGYAEYAVAEGRYVFPIPKSYPDAAAAPLLCAGLIGFRALRMVERASRIGLYGFGAAAHIIAQIAAFQEKKVFAFTRPGDSEAQALALRCGACWAGGSDTAPPEPLDAAILFAPVGALVPVALKAVVKGGVVVCAGIHMSKIPAFPYALLWGERVLRSVANLCRQDGLDFFKVVSAAPVRTEVECFTLSKANQALAHLKAGKIKGAAVLVMEDRPETETEGLRLFPPRLIPAYDSPV